MKSFPQALLVLVPLAVCVVAPHATANDVLATKDRAALQSLAQTPVATPALAATLQQVSAAPSLSPLDVLAEFSTATPLGQNWLTNAYENICERVGPSGVKALAGNLEAYARDTQRSAVARRLAYQTLLTVDSGAADRLIPGMLQDPGDEFRRDAVTRLLNEAAALPKDQQAAAKDLYRKALSGAVHEDQFQAIQNALKDLGDEVSLAKHFAFVQQWQGIGPFDNTDTKAFHVVYPPEEKFDPTGKYPGKTDEVAWQAMSSSDEKGLVDVAKLLGPHKGAVVYGHTTVRAAAASTGEIRISTPNAWKLWVNGKLLFAREEYHRGMFFDQYKVPVSLVAGENTVLLKLLQNEQKEDWAQDFQFQLRLCDPAGTPLAVSSSLAQ